MVKISLMALLVVGLASPVSFAQPKAASPVDGVTIYLWPGPREIDKKNVDLITYFFLLDISDLKGKTFKSLDAISLTTNVGEVAFSGPTNLAEAPRYLFGSLKTAQKFERFLINKVTGTIDGQSYDLSSNVAPVNILTTPIDRASSIYLSCPPKLLDFYVLEGVFEGLETGDYVHALVKVNGQTQDFMLDLQSLAFFEDEKNVGKKIKIYVEKRQEPTFEEGEDCITMDLIVKYIAPQTPKAVKKQ
ncbi:MAG: hypothetical protein LBI10_03000 [Deltaproteobacteria bacterium]|nr:hypothetical protein [Deltaproteobacteria bacterium]